jgi:hypothetical protein
MLLDMRRRGLLTGGKARHVYAPRQAQDDFGEVRERKKAARSTAMRLGHDLSPWHRRPNDVAGRWNAFCLSCNRPAVICTEAPEGLADSYGAALTEDCLSGGNDFDRVPT